MSSADIDVTNSNRPPLMAALCWSIGKIAGDLYGGVENTMVDLKRIMPEQGFAVDLYGNVTGPNRNFRGIRPSSLPYVGQLLYCLRFMRASRSAAIWQFHNCPIGCLLQPRRSVAVFQNDMHIDYHRIVGKRYGRAAFIFNSEYLKKKILADHPSIPAGRCFVVHNAVDTGIFKPGESRGADALPEITFSGQWNRKKGLHILLRAARILQEQGVQFSLNLVGGFSLWPGYGMPELSEEEFNSSIAGINNVNVIGKLPPAEIVPILQRSRVAAVPSTWEEPFGKTSIEALACGVPVIATRVGGLQETVVDGESGFLVPPNDPEALASKLKTLLLDSSSAAKMGKAARLRAETYFDLRRWAGRIARICREQIGKR